MKHPDVAALARAAVEASGEPSVAAFVARFDGAIGLRTFWGWHRGEAPAAPLALFVLRQVAAGWKPWQ